MNSDYRRGLRALGVLAAGLACLGIALGQNNVKAFVGARVIDGTGKAPIEKATIVVRDGKIQAVGANVKVPAGAQVIDASGKTIMPGMVNSHGHLGEAHGLKTGPEIYTRDELLSQLGLYARYGVTTVFSFGSDRKEAFQIRDEQDTAQLNRARAYLAGMIIVGYTPEAVRKMVDEVAETKPNIIKVRVDDQLGTAKK